MASLTYDQAQISAYVSFVNVSCVFYVSGLGIGNTFRTHVSNLIGAGRFELAKNVTWFYQFAIFVLAAILGIILVLSKHLLAGIYTPIVEVNTI